MDKKEQEINQSLIISKDKFLRECNPEQALIKFENIRSLPDIFKVKTPTLAKLYRMYDKEFVLDYLGMWIINICKFLNLGKSMSEAQVKETAYLIFDTYKTLTVADIHFIFKQAKLGANGKFYDRIDGVIILSWFSEHFENRCAEAENLSLKEHDANTGHEKVARQYATSESEYRKFIDKYKSEKHQSDLDDFKNEISK